MPFKPANISLLEEPFTIPSRDWDNRAPAWADIWSGSFRQENSLGSMLGYGFSLPNPQGNYNENFNRVEAIPEPFLDYVDSYWWANSPEDVDYISERIRKQLRDRQTLQEAGFGGVLPTLAAGLLDPINLPFLYFPVAGAAGRGLLRGAGRAALENVPGAIGVEAALNLTQETRTFEDNAMNVAGSAVLSSILGGASGALGKKFQAIADQIDADIKNKPVPRDPTGKIIRGGFGEEIGVVGALDQALTEGIMDEGTYRTLKHLATTDPEIDRNTVLEINDTVRIAKAAELEGEGLPEDIVGESTSIQFKTSKGSTYVFDGTSTVRNKSLHEGHDPKDVGIKDKSALTIFVAPEVSQRIGELNNLQSDSRRILIDRKSKTIWHLSKVGSQKDYGKSRMPENNTYSLTPKVGLSPVEVWRPDERGLYRDNHPGNKIVEINPGQNREAASSTGARILGSTQRQDAPEMAQIVIRLYNGSDADTALEEWYHRFFKRSMSPEQRQAFDEYHRQTGDIRSLEEHFAQEGRDFFFSDKLHEAAGPIRELFLQAKKALLDLIARVRKLRGTNIPQNIQEIYRAAGSPEPENLDAILSRIEDRWQTEMALTRTEGPTEAVLTPELPIEEPWKTKLREAKIAELRRLAEVERTKAEQADIEVNPYRVIFQDQVPKEKRNPDRPWWFQDRRTGELRSYKNKKAAEAAKDAAERMDRLGIDPESFQVRQIDTDEFKRWFGKSKIVDSNGKPLVMYHGSPSKELKDNAFEMRDLGTFFTSDPKLADSYALNGSTYPVYLNIENPATAKNVENIPNWNNLSDEAIRAELESRGFDGYDPKGNRKIVVAFRPEQIKSDIGNRGTFDPSNPDISYQMRVMKDLGELNPNALVQPKWMPDYLWRSMAKVHPGLSPFVLKHLEKPKEFVLKLVETPEFTWGNMAGKGTTQAIETLIKRERNQYTHRAKAAYWVNYTNYAARLRNEANRSTDLQDVSRVFMLKEKLRTKGPERQFRRDVYDALMELSEGKKSLLKTPLSSRYEPEVIKAATEIGDMMNEIGNRLIGVKLLDDKLKEALQNGYIHMPRVWNLRAVTEHRRRLLEILDRNHDELNPFAPEKGILKRPPTEAEIAQGIVSVEEDVFMQAPKPDFNRAIDKIVKSPTGHMGIEILTDDPLKPGEARFLQDRALDIDTRKLVIKDDAGNLIEFVETDPERIMDSYLSSTLPDLVLAERNGGDITLKNLIEEIEAEAQGRASNAKNDKEYNEIIQERDNSIRNILALRDLLRGDYHPNGRPDPTKIPYRLHNAVMTWNAMAYLGGMTVSSVGDIVRPIWHWGMTPYARSMMTYVNMPKEARKAFKQEVYRVWGAVGDMYLSSRLAAITDLKGTHSTLSAPERAIRFAGDQMGLFTGIDWWNTQLKTLSAFTANHSVIDYATQVKRAGAFDMDAAGKAGIDTGILADIARMGISLDDLHKVADQVEKWGEKYQDTVYLPRVDKWDDSELASRYMSAMTKEVDELIVTPGVGDRPLWMHTQTGQIISQFKAYPMSGMRKIFIQGMQRNDSRLATSMMFSTLLGGAVYAFKEWERGSEPSDDPKDWLFNAIDRAGVAGYILDANHYLEALSGGELGISPMLGMEQGQRFEFQKDFLDIAFGPTGSTVKNLNTVGTLPGRAIFGEGIDRQDVNAIYRLTWYSKVFGIRWVMENLRAAAIENLPDRTGTEE